MTSRDKWNLIVDRHSKLYSALESEVQKEWELYCSDLLDYKKLLNEIDTQRSLSVGSGRAIIPDIILKIDGDDAFDIELKQYSHAYQTDFETQLISYLNQTHLSVGMIVCNKIYLYHYEYSTNQKNSIEIPFEKDNPDGIALVELLVKDSFSADRIKEYIEQKKAKADRIRKIRESITSEWLMSVAVNALKSQYSDEDVEVAIESYSFNIIEHHSSHSTYSLSAQPQSIVTPDSRNNQEACSNSASSLLPIFKKWCVENANNGRIDFNPSLSDGNIIRFTTKQLDALLPYQSNVCSGMGRNNGHFYAFEIIDEVTKRKFNIRLLFAKKNAPAVIQDGFSRFFAATGKHPKKDDWQWFTVFSSNNHYYNNNTTENEVFAALGKMFNEINMPIDSSLRLM